MKKKGRSCADHPQSPAVAQCVTCRKLLCESCRVEIAHHPYCSLCARHVVEESVNLAVVKGEAAHERRRFPRVSTVVPIQVHVEDAEPLDGVLVNLNVGGAGILTPRRLREEAQVHITVTLPGQSHPLTLQAGVMHTKEMNNTFYYAGVLFMNLGDERRWIEDFLRQRTAKPFVRLEKVSFV